LASGPRISSHLEVCWGWRSIEPLRCQWRCLRLPARRAESTASANVFAWLAQSRRQRVSKPRSRWTSGPRRLPLPWVVGARVAEVKPAVGLLAGPQLKNSSARALDQGFEPGRRPKEHRARFAPLPQPGWGEPRKRQPRSPIVAGSERSR